MPSEKEFAELVEYCTCEWTTQSGVDGYKFTSKINGHSIFLPAAGNFGNTGNYGFYWSSSLNEYDVMYPKTLSFGSGNFLIVGSGHNDRSMGQSIRPVYDEGTEVTDVNLNFTNITMLCGETFTLTATISPDNATIKDINWSSNNTAVVTADQNGNVTAVKDGNATITATTLNGHTATCTIKVQSSGTPGVYDAIDLGLSVKWASFNVGATKPEEYGDYFAWGEIETKSSYNWSSYKWCNGPESITKYNSQTYYGNVDNLNLLQSEDDVAHVKWGGNWRMPTTEEYNELVRNCNVVWTKIKGKEGIKLTSKINDYCIFFPAAGYHRNDIIELDGNDGRYWSSTLFSTDGNCGHFLFFRPDSNSNTLGQVRCDGLSVRPVNF